MNKINRLTDKMRCLVAGWLIAPSALRALLLDLDPAMTVKELRAVLRGAGNEKGTPRELAALIRRRRGDKHVQ